MYKLYWSKINQGKTYISVGSRSFSAYFIIHKDAEKVVVARLLGDNTTDLNFREFNIYYKKDDGSATKIFWNSPSVSLLREDLYIKKQVLENIFSEKNQYYIKNSMRL